MPVQAGQVIAERYRLVRPIGKGAQASVWIAEHLALGSQVAVKLMDPELVEQGDSKERFRREAAAAAQLRSAHVVQILDHGIDGNQPFMVMELLDGEDLWQRLERKNRLTLVEASVVVTQIARALARAHAAGIVHRDLKPENVYLVPNEDDEIAKVLDFGVAKFLEAGAAQRSTSAGTLLGTPHYMSPEQVRGVGEIDHRSDLWALGVIAYQLTVGDLPFESEGVGDLLIKITMEKIPTPSKVRSDLPKTFDTWFAKACHRDVEQRFQTARELAEALARVAGLIPGPADSMRGVPVAVKGRSEPPAFDVDFDEGASLPPPPPPPPPAGAAAAKEDVDEDWPDEPPPPGNSVLPPAPATAAAPAIPPPPKAPGSPPRVAPARPIPATAAARAMAPTEPALDEVAKPAASTAAAPKSAVGPTPPAVATPPAPANPPPAAAPPPPRAAPPAAARAVEALPPPRPRAEPAPASTSDAPPRSKSPLSSTISGASGDVLPPPELDGSRKKRALTYVLVAAILGAGALTFAVVRSHGTDAPPASASKPEPVRPRDPPAVVAPPEPPPTPSSSASAAASGAAVDPGQSQRPIKSDPTPSRPAPQPGGPRPKRPPPANNGEIVIEVPLPEREVPVPPSP